jgi:hypothetical protein
MSPPFESGARRIYTVKPPPGSWRFEQEEPI